LPLEGQMIIITGASSGIGYGTARRLAQNEGARVVAVARRRVFRIEALAAQIREQTGEDRILPLTTDMAARDQAEALVQQVEERFGRIDGFVHAVNRVLRLSALDVSDPEFDLTMQVNVKSALYGVQAVVPVMRRQGAGTVVIYNPTPRATTEFVASEAVYTAAAHALSALTAGWTRQLESAGIQVREIAPTPEEGAADTTVSANITHDALLVQALRDSALPQVSKMLPLARPETFAFAHPQVLSSRGGLILKQF